jgi:hypothetical protein
MRARVTPPAPAVTGVLARGLTDRRFCRALLRGRPPRLPPDERAAAAAVDAERLALFAGFITKVRHSDLFEHLPGTLALLRLFGVELEVFRDYFLDHDPQPRGDTDAKLVAVLAHLARFSATRRGRAVAGLRDVLAHERCLWEVRRELARGPAPPPPPGAVALGGPVRLARLVRDPYAVIEAASRGRRLRGRPRGARWWLYFADAAAGELRTIEIDRDVAATIAAIAPSAAPPGRRSRLPARRRGAILARLAEAGVIRLEGGPP